MAGKGELDRLRLLTAPELAGLEPAEELGAVPEFCWLDKTWLHVEPLYQRAADKGGSRTLIRRIAETFRWAKFSPLTVVQQDDGRFLVVDGQHRALAALLVPGVTEVPCWVVQADDISDQAKVFVGVNSDRRPVQPLELFKAQIAAGNPDATQVQKVCDEARLRIVFSLPGGSGLLPPMTTQSVSAIRKMIAAHGEGPVRAALTVMGKAWPNIPGAFRGALITAIVAFLVQHGPRVDRDRLAKVLATHIPDTLIERARSMKTGSSASTQSSLLVALILAYDKGLAPEKRLVPVEKVA